MIFQTEYSPGCDEVMTAGSRAMPVDQMTEDKHPSVLIATSEVSPYAKTGGLGDVMGALPEALVSCGARVSLIMPAYQCVTQGGFILDDTGITIQAPVSNHLENGRLLKSELNNGVPVYLVQSDKYFNRENLYGSYEGDYPDNAERFVFFSRAILEFLRKEPHQILHANDWQTALAIAFLKSQPARYQELASMKSVMTIHNLGYQGRFQNSNWPLFGLDRSLFDLHYLEFYNDINFLKGGVVFADVITTVSPNYAEEIKTAEQGFGLEGVFQERTAKLFGILNGVDYKIWNPDIDGYLARKYNVDNMSGKKICKSELQRYFGLAQNDKAPVIGMVTRLSRQKGMDLVYQICGDLVDRDCQFVLLGSGDGELQDIFSGLVKKYPGRMGIEIGFRDNLAHQIIAGSDLLLMPSLYEPGGLTHLYGMKYGTIPIVRATGGLKDTVIPFSAQRGKVNGNGFVFKPYRSDHLLATIDQALDVFSKKNLWRELIRNDMESDFSWERSAREYMNIYRSVLFRT
jgi:starch synthase